MSKGWREAEGWAEGWERGEGGIVVKRVGRYSNGICGGYEGIGSCSRLHT